MLIAKHLLSSEAIQEINQLEELTTMLADRIDEWEAHWVAKGRTEGEARGLKKGRTEGLEKGRTEGLEKGLEKGRSEGQAQLLIRLLEEKFGSLATRVQTQIYALDESQVLECVKRTFTAKTVQEVLGRRH